MNSYRKTPHIEGKFGLTPYKKPSWPNSFLDDNVISNEIIGNYMLYLRSKNNIFNCVFTLRDNWLPLNNNWNKQPIDIEFNAVSLFQ